MIKLLLVVSVLASDRPVLVDRVAVLVDGEAILRSEVSERARTTSKPFTDAQSEAIEQLLVEHDATRLGLRVAPEEVDRAFASVAEGNQLTAEQLEKEVVAQGLTLRGYRWELARQLIRMRWLMVKLEGGGATLSAAQRATEERKLIAALRTAAVIEVKT